MSVRLRYLAQVNPPTAEFDQLASEAEVSFLPLEAVWRDESIDTSRLRLKEQVASGYTRFREGDIIVPKITPTFQADRAAIVRGLSGGVGAGTTELHVIRPGRNLDPRFARYVLSSRPFLLGGKASMIGVAGQKRVPEDWLRDFIVLVTDFREQRAIADFLDRETARIDALTAKKKQLKQQLTERFKAMVMEEVFRSGDETWVPLRRLVDLLPGYSFSSDDMSSDSEDTVRLLRGINIAPGSLRWEEVAYVSSDIASACSRFELRQGDIVIGMDRPVISGGMRVAMLSPDDAPSLLVQRVARIRPRDGVEGTFVRYALESEAFVAYFSPITTGVSVPHISPEQILDFRLPRRTRSQQVSICNRLSQAEGLKRRLTSNLDHQASFLTEHRQALVTAAVTGQMSIPAA